MFLVSRGEINWSRKSYYYCQANVERDWKGREGKSCALFAWTGLTALLSVSVIRTVDRKLCPITCIVCATGQLQRDRNLHIDSCVLFVAVGLLSASSSTDHRLLPSAPMVWRTVVWILNITWKRIPLFFPQPNQKKRNGELTLLSSCMR